MSCERTLEDIKEAAERRRIAAQAEQTVGLLRDQLNDLLERKHAEMLPILRYRERADGCDDRRYWNGRLADVERAYAGPKAALEGAIVRIISLLPVPPLFVVTEAHSP